ncbi:MAG: ABC-type multidrug transport system fused ATPase/permease subunit [Crocinitomix sp.]|jgi:ABC-type multidrug transport system fused ATPase/permease subunit
MKETSQVRKSLHKPYCYDKTSYKHNRDLGKFIYFLLICLILSVTSGFLFSLSTCIISIAVIFGATYGAITVLRWYNLNHYRYYRLIKRTEQNGHRKIEHYVVQTCISNKKIEQFSKNKNVKWKLAKDCSQIEDAEIYFDIKTIEKKVTETVISKVKKSLRNQNHNFGHRFLEIHNINRVQLKPFISILWGVGFLMFSLVFFSVFFSIFYINPILFFQIGLPIIICVIIVYLFYTVNHRYHRLIRRTVIQGRYEDKSVYIQSFISRKKIKEIGEEKHRRWIDFYIANNNRFDYIEDAEFRFNEATAKKTVIDEVL